MKTPRNAPCPCGSGKKLKHCCKQTPSAVAPPGPQLARALLQARQFSQQGHAESARQRYLEVLRADPNHTEALYGLASLALRSAAPLEAAKLLHRAIKVSPKLAILHDAMGTALMARGRAKQAIGKFKQANTLDPNLVSAWYNLGLASETSGAADQAEAAYLRCLKLTPDYAPAHNNLGNVHRLHEQPEKAIACYEQALAIQSDLPQARTNLAMAHSALAIQLHQQGDPKTALQHFDSAIALDPENPAYPFNLGCSYAELGHYRQAIANYQLALEIDPDHSDAANNIGIALRGKGDHSAAIEHYQGLLTRQPNNTRVLQNLALVLRRTGCHSKAIEYLDRALSLAPNNAELHSERGAALNGQGRLNEAIVEMRLAVTLAPQRTEIRSNLLMTLNYAENCSAEQLYQDHCKYGQELKSAKSSFKRSNTATNSNPRKIRIGYVSADLRLHSVSYFLEPVLRHHDRNRFEIFAYYNGRRLDAVSERMKSCCDVWRDVASLPDQQLTAMIQRDQIDILIDLSGHSEGNRLPVFADRAAAVQITWLGYPNSTGLAAMDYRITDRYTDPEEEQGLSYSENLIRLPGHFSCYQPSSNCPEIGKLPSTATGQITYGCFNNISKLTPQVLTTWGRILKSVADSRLLLKSRGLVDPETVVRLQRCFQELGIDPARISLRSHDQNRQHHLACYGEVDIALDPFPYNGTTTTCEALWMGAPVIALKGDSHRGRVSASFLDGIGLGELVADDLDNYLAIAVDLAADRERLTSIRASLRERLEASALLDGSGFTRKLEAAYRSVWSPAQG